jgi:hypothetical protein
MQPGFFAIKFPSLDKIYLTLPILKCREKALVKRKTLASRMASFFAIFEILNIIILL